VAPVSFFSMAKSSPSGGQLGAVSAAITRSRTG
jgi:hypothetical protein